MLLTVPAAAALFAVPGEIIAVLFERGAFKPADTRQVAGALGLFALGLPAFVMIKVFSPAFFAREDTRTPMRYAAWSLGLNTAGSVGLFFLFREIGLSPHLGIAVATSIGGWINAVLLYRKLRALGHFRADDRLRRSIPAILIASLVMTVVLLAGAYWLIPWLGPGNPLTVRGSALAALVAAGAIAYFLIVFATGALKPAMLKRLLRRGS